MRVHVLELLRVPTPAGVTIHNCAVHAPIPTGNNLADVPWKTAFLGSGRSGVTQMREGIAAGEITTLEKATILSGDVIELNFALAVDSSGQIVAVRDGTLTQLVNDKLTALQDELRQYGRTAT